MSLPSLRRSRRATVAAALAATAVLSGGVAYAAAGSGPAIETTTPVTAAEVQNVDVLRQQIANYYGDPTRSGQIDPAGNYAKEARQVALAGRGWLDQPHATTGRKAIVLDVDDTALSTWNYEVASNWDYDPTTNGDYVTTQEFPAVPGMVDLVQHARKKGYAVFFLTGRGAAQEEATLGNLVADGKGIDAGFPAPTTLTDGEDGLFTKPAVADYPGYLKTACADDPQGACTTVHYKAATRAHIESLGYDLVANFGDQYSDLEGGYADATFKLPNPNYYLP